MQKSVASNVEEYIGQFPTATQKKLKQLRKIIRAAAPQAEETISYMMPAYKLHGPLVYFAGYAHHIGFYPGGTVALFEKETQGFKTSKGTIQLPLDQPLPVGLINRIVQFRVRQNEEKAVAKKKSKK